jgi:hypothetical protein
MNLHDMLTNRERIQSVSYSSKYFMPQNKVECKYHDYRNQNE